jgi:hypothetical protein
MLVYHQRKYHKKITNIIDDEHRGMDIFFEVLPELSNTQIKTCIISMQSITLVHSFDFLSEN